MTIRGIITVLVLAILFGLVVVWISKQGGWKGGGLRRQLCLLPPPRRLRATEIQPEYLMHQKAPGSHWLSGVLCYSCPLWAA